MKTIETTVYTINELDEKAKQKAREWYLTLDFGDAFGDAFEQMAEDAKNIGLDLNKKAFIVSAIECSEAILREHGENCDTYKAAKAFDDAMDALPELPSEDAPEYYEIERGLCESVDAIEGDFLTDILDDYAIMLRKEIEYQESNEYIDENILSNEYTFTIEGNRFG